VPDADPDPDLAADFEPLNDEVCALLDHAELTQALDRIWQRVRRLNRYVEERAPWQLAKDDSQRERLDATLRSLAEGLRCVTVLLHPYMPDSTEKLLDALGQTGAGRCDLERAAFGAVGGGAAVTQLAPLFPKPQ
jgi:methionyl-tRNA synthetase